MKRSVCLIIAVVFLVAGAMMFHGTPLFGRSQGVNALSPDQVAKEHGRIFSENPGVLQKALANGTGDAYAHGGHSNTTLTETVPASVSRSDLEIFSIARLLCRHDLTVVGRIGTGTSHLTNDGGFLYTDWGFLVEQVIRNNPEAPVVSGNSIIVVKAGGKLQVQGRTVYAVDDNFAGFESGQEYLLFLDYVPKTGAYAAYAPSGYGISGSKTTSLIVGGVRGVTRRLDSMNKAGLLETLTLASTFIDNNSRLFSCTGERP